MRKYIAVTSLSLDLFVFGHKAENRPRRIAITVSYPPWRSTTSVMENPIQDQEALTKELTWMMEASH